MASAEVVNAAYRRYRQLIETDTKLARLRQMITSGNSTMEAMQKYSTRAGELGAQAIEEYAGKADFGELADAIMKLDHEYVSNASAKALKQVSGNLNPSLADYNPNDTAQIVSRMSDGDDAADGVASLRNSFIQQSQKVADEAERRTAEFMSNSGVEVLVTRDYDDIGVHTTDKGGGDVCQWCLDRCGTDVPYEEAYLMGMFERHPGCGCIITYRKPNGVTYRQGKGDWETNNWNTLQEQDERDKRVSLNVSYAQNYRPVTRGQAETFKTLNGDNIIATKVEGYGNDVYVSENVSIKPKALHNLNKATGTAADKFGIDENKKPILLVAKSEEINGSLARYDAVNNVIAYSPEMGDRAKAIPLQRGQAAGNDMYSTPFHEMYHCKQAQDYEAKHGKITGSNYQDYIENLREQCKANLDKLGISDKNVGEISDYAQSMYFHGAYDEVEAEYQTLKALERK